MAVNLVPQDKFTLELLASVLAKMYRHSVKHKNTTVAKVAESGNDAPSTGPGRSCQNQTVSECSHE